MQSCPVLAFPVPSCSVLSCIVLSCLIWFRLVWFGFVWSGLVWSVLVGSDLICLPVCLCVRLFVSLAFCLSVCLCACLVIRYTGSKRKDFKLALLEREMDQHLLRRCLEVKRKSRPYSSNAAARLELLALSPQVREYKDNDLIVLSVHV